MSCRPLILSVSALFASLSLAHAADNDDFVFSYDAEALQSQTAHARTMDRLAKEARSFCVDHRVRGLAERRIALDCQVAIIETVSAELGDAVMRFSENQPVSISN